MRLSAKTGAQSPILSGAIIRISGATIERAFWSECVKAFDTCAVTRIIASNPSVRIETRRAVWTGKIMVYSSDDDVMELLDERVNSLPAPFELEWHRLSGKAWDWKLVRVSNSAFEIPADIY